MPTTRWAALGVAVMVFGIGVAAVVPSVSIGLRYVIFVVCALLGVAVIFLAPKERVAQPAPPPPAPPQTTEATNRLVHTESLIRGTRRNETTWEQDLQIIFTNRSTARMSLDAPKLTMAGEFIEKARLETPTLMDGTPYPWPIEVDAQSSSPRLNLRVRVRCSPSVPPDGVTFEGSILRIRDRVSGEVIALPYPGEVPSAWR